MFASLKRAWYSSASGPQSGLILCPTIKKRPDGFATFLVATGARFKRLPEIFLWSVLSCLIYC